MFRFTVLVPVCGVDEISAERFEGVEDGKSGFFGAFAETGFVSVAEIHGAETEGGDADVGCGGELAVAEEGG